MSTLRASAFALAWLLAGVARVFAGAQGEAAAPAEDFAVTIMATSYIPEPPSPDLPVIKRMQEYSGVRVDVKWMASQGYAEKLAVTLASAGENMPMVVQVDNQKAANIVAAARGGLFWEITPYLKEYPNLKELDAVRLRNASIDGKTYGLYRQRPLAADGVVYNKTWADALGITEPKKVDDLYSMIRAFTKNDPDGDGKEDTFGFIQGQNMAGYGVILAYLGGPNKWQYADGKMVPEFATPEYLDMLNWYKRLYDEKLMNTDFPVVTNTRSREFMVNEKGGVWFGWLADSANIQSPALKINPKTRIWVANPLEGPKGPRALGATGYAGQFVFMKPSLKTEGMLRHALKFFDKLSDPEMQNLARWGLEGRHFVMVEGFRERKTEHDIAYTNEVNPFRALKLHYDDKADAGRLSQPYAKTREVFLSAEPHVVPNPVEPLISPTAVQRGVELDKIMQDAAIKYILGEIDVRGFREAMDRWSKSGGDKVAEEYAAEYRRLTQ